MAAAAIHPLLGAVIRRDRLVRGARLLPFIVGRKAANVFVAVEFGRSVNFVTGSTELGLAEQRPHDGAFVTGNVRENLLVGKVTEDRRAIFFGQQGWAANSKTAGAVQTRAGDGMADRAGHAFVIKRCKRRLLPRAVPGERAGKQRYRRVTTLAVPRELNAARAQQNVYAFTIKRLACRIAM